jgi:hypothetical protein
MPKARKRKKLVARRSTGAGRSVRQAGRADGEASEKSAGRCLRAKPPLPSVARTEGATDNEAEYASRPKRVRRPNTRIAAQES